MAPFYDVKLLLDLTYHISLALLVTVLKVSRDIVLLGMPDTYVHAIYDLPWDLNNKVKG